MEMVNVAYKGVNKGHYSPAVISGGTMYISGQLSLDPDTRQVTEGGFREHAAQALDNVDRVLRTAGLGRDSVVFCRVYITDADKWDEVNDVYSEFFGDHKPARIVVQTDKMHFGCKVEIEAIAEVNR